MAERFELVEKANIPSCHTLMSAGVIGYNNPLNLGLLGMHGSFTTNKAVDDADVLIAIGTRFSDRVALDTNEFAKKAQGYYEQVRTSEDCERDS